ncbi:MAG: hypothetical protein KDC90_15265 [Ignavibacteriae bacterium]|nr:hypothetical protein [Ignavibacteriota bacterium]
MLKKILCLLNFEKENTSFFADYLVDDDQSQIICERIPDGMSFLELKKWAKYKESLFFHNKNFYKKRVENWYIWIFTDLFTKRFVRWALLEKVSALKKMINNDVQENEIWFFDDGNKKTVFGLFRGVLVCFKVVSKFNNTVLDNLINQMKRYTFVAPKVRMFGTWCELDYKLDFYETSAIESKLCVKIEEIKLNFVKRISDLAKSFALNAVFSLFCMVLAIYFNNRLCNAKRDLVFINSQISSLESKIVTLPDISHVKFLMRKQHNGINLTSVLNLLGSQKYTISFYGESKLTLHVQNERIRHEVEQLFRESNFTIIQNPCSVV